MKTCTKCGIDKPLDDFYRQPRGKDGYMGRCKECHKARVKEYTAQHSDASRAWHARYYREVIKPKREAEQTQRRADVPPKRKRTPKSVPTVYVTPAQKPPEPTREAQIDAYMNRFRERQDAKAREAAEKAQRRQEREAKRRAKAAKRRERKEATLDPVQRSLNRMLGCRY